MDPGVQEGGGEPTGNDAVGIRNAATVALRVARAGSEWRST